MKSKITSTIQLMKDGEVFHSIDIKNVSEYHFSYDSEKLAYLYLDISDINMYDLDILVKEPYESYIVMGAKQYNNKIFPIPARVFKHIHIEESDNRARIFFSEK